jgi:hypothetical protein
MLVTKKPKKLRMARRKRFHIGGSPCEERTSEA